jgi:GNAT superfamily N-acetyltransferase
MSAHHKLDNPVWYSLTESHKNRALVYSSVKFYDPVYCAFGAFNTIANDPQDLVVYAKTVPSFFIFGAKPILGESLYLKEELLCYQMIIQEPVALRYRDEIIKLNQSHRAALLALVKIVYPEYFKSKTTDLGNYYGIFKEKQLVAITGERLQMNDFIEVSAVITHPDHTGKGYAKQLVAHTANSILKQNKTPFLHVSVANIGAVKLYEKLGFNTRTTITIWQIAEK